jgi:glucosamine 6-phosphate synthetase-like amidotransferase/phosphosugar isomerase protein
MYHWSSRDSLNEKKRKEEERKKQEEAKIAEFVAAGKSIHLGHATRELMEKVNRRQMRNESLSAIDKKAKEDECLLFGPDGKIKAKWR